MNTPDIELHYGYRKCGKSEIVEQMLAGYKKKIYFGTLPVTAEYKLTIYEHVQRRGNGWTTINLTHDLTTDLSLINQTFKALNSPVVGMLDGLWTWYIFANQYSAISPNDFAQKICPILSEMDILKIVDIGSYVLERVDDNKQKLEKLHDVLITQLNIKKLIDYRYERFQDTMDR